MDGIPFESVEGDNYSTKVKKRFYQLQAAEAILYAFSLLPDNSELLKDPIKQTL